MGEGIEPEAMAYLQGSQGKYPQTRVACLEGPYSGATVLR